MPYEASDLTLLSAAVRTSQRPLLTIVISPVDLRWRFCHRTVDRECMGSLLDSDFHSSDLCFARSNRWGKLGQGYERSFCIISYNCS